MINYELPLLSYYKKNKKKVSSLVLPILLIILFIFSSNPYTVSENGYVVENHTYYLNQNFGPSFDNSLWTGNIEIINGKAVVSSSAYFYFSLDHWNSIDDLLLNVEMESGRIDIKTQTKIKLMSQYSSVQAKVVTDNFVGYKSTNYLTLESQDAKDLILILSAGTYSNIQLYSERDYSIVDDVSFKLPTSVTDRTQPSLSDKKVLLENGYTVPATSITVDSVTPSVNARAKKIYDFSSRDFSLLENQQVLDIATDPLKLPGNSQLRLSIGAAISSSAYMDYSKVKFRIHFIPNGIIDIGTFTAITPYMSFAQTDPIFTDEIDISAFANMKGRFSIEISRNDKFQIRQFADADVYFILLDAVLKKNVNSQPVPISNEIDAALDYVHLDADNTEIVKPYANNDIYYLRSATDGYMGSYLLSTTQLIASTDFANADHGTFARDYYTTQDLNNPGTAVFNNQGFVEIQEAKMVYRGHTISDLKQQYDPDFWERNIYSFSADFSPLGNYTKGGITIYGEGVSPSGIFIELDAESYPESNTHKDYINVYRTTMNDSETLISSHEIQPDTFEFDFSSKITMIAYSNLQTIDVYLLQGIDDNIESYHVTSILKLANGLSGISDMSIRGDSIRVHYQDISTVNANWYPTMYVKAMNPSFQDITLTFKRDHAMTERETLGTVTIPAKQTSFKFYPVDLDTTVNWQSIDRIIIEKDQPNAEILIDSFDLDTFAQPGFEINPARYYNKHPFAVYDDSTMSLEYFQASNQALTPSLFYNSISPSFETGNIYSYATQSSNGALGLITSGTMVSQGVNALQATLNNPSSTYSFDLPIDLHIGSNTVRRLSYDLSTQGFRSTTSLSVEIKNDVLGISIPAGMRGYSTMQGSQTDGYDISSFSTVKNLAINDNTVPEFTYRTIGIDLSSFTSSQLQNDNWKIQFTISDDDSLAFSSTPKVRIDNFYVGSSTPNNFISSYAVSLAAGPQSIAIRALADAYRTNGRTMFPTYQIGIRPFGTTTEYEILGNIQIRGQPGLVSQGLTTFTLGSGGRYELAILYDDNINQQEIEFELHKILHLPSRSMTSAVDYDGGPDYLGHSSDFSSDQKGILDTTSNFQELTSFDRNIFSNSKDHIFSSYVDRYFSYSTTTGSINSNVILNQDFSSLSNDIEGTHAPGWDMSLHTDAVVAEAWSDGYTTGSGFESTMYHARIVADEGRGSSPAAKFVDRNNELGLGQISQIISQQFTTSISDLGWEHGDTITISYWQKSDSDKGVAVMIEYTRDQGSKISLTDSYYTNVTALNEWEYVETTFEINSDMALDSPLTLIFDGADPRSQNGTLWLDNIRVFQPDENNLNQNFQSTPQHVLDHSTGWTTSNDATVSATNSNIYLVANDTLTGSDDIYISSTKLLPYLSYGGYQLQLSDVGYFAGVTEGVRHHISIWSGDQRIMRYGYLSTSNNVDGYELIEIGATSFKDQSLVAPPSASVSIGLIADQDGTTNIHVSGITQTIDQTIVAGIPTHITLESYLIPDEVIRNPLIEESTHVRLGETRFLSTGNQLIASSLNSGIPTNTTTGTYEIVDFETPDVIDSDLAIKLNSTTMLTFHNSSTIDSTGIYRFGSWIYIPSSFVPGTSSNIIQIEVFDENSTSIAVSDISLPVDRDRWVYIATDMNISTIPSSFDMRLGYPTDYSGDIFFSGISAFIVEQPSVMTNRLYSNGLGSYTIHTNTDTTIYPFAAIDTSIMGGEWSIDFVTSNGTFNYVLDQGKNLINTQILTDAATITEIILQAPIEISKIDLSIDLYTIGNAEINFTPDATIDTVAYVEDTGIVVQLAGSSSDEIYIDVVSENFNVAADQFFRTEYQGNSASVATSIDIGGTTYQIDITNNTQYEIIRGNFAEQSGTVSAFTYLLSSNEKTLVYLQNFVTYDIDFIHFGTSIRQGDSPDYQITDYIDASRGILDISTSALSTVFVEFDYFNATGARFIETGTEKYGNGTVALHAEIDSYVVTQDIFDSQIVNRRNIDSIITEDPQSMILYFKIDGNVQLNVDKVKFYTISDWKIPDVFDNKYQALYIEISGTELVLYDNFMSDEFSFSQFPAFNNPDHRNIVTTRPYPFGGDRSKIDDFEGTNNFSFGTIQNGVLHLEQSTSSQETITSSSQFSILNGKYLVFRASTSVSESTARLTKMAHSSSGTVFWYSPLSPYIIDSTPQTFMVDLSNSPFSTPQTWGQGSGITFYFDSMYTTPSTIEIEYISINTNPVFDITYKQENIPHIYTPVNAEFNSGILTSDGTGNMELQTSVINNYDISSATSMVLDIAGNSFQSGYYLGYREGGVITEIAQLGSDDAFYQISGLTSIPDIVIYDTDSMVEAGVQVEFNSITFEHQELTYEANEMGSIFTGLSDTTQQGIDMNIFSGLGLNAMTLQSNLASGLVSSNDYFILDFSINQDLADTNPQIQLVDNINGTATSFSDAKIYSDAGTYTAVISFEDYNFITSPQLRVVSNTTIPSTATISLISVFLKIDRVYLPYDNLESIQDTAGLLIDPEDDKTSLSIGEMDLDSTQIYRGLLLDFEVDTDILLDFDVIAYHDDKEKETSLVLDHFNPDKFSKVYTTGRHQVFLPFVDSRIDGANKILLRYIADNEFGSTKIKQNSLTAYNSEVMDDQSISISSYNLTAASNSTSIQITDGRHLSSAMNITSTSDLIGVTPYITSNTLYHLNFYFKPLQAGIDEQLYLHYNSSGLTSINFDLNSNDGDWVEVDTILNITSLINMNNSTGLFILETGLDSTTSVINSSNHSILISDMRLNPVDMNNLITSNQKIEAPAIPAIDLTITPRASGMILNMFSANNSIVKLKFNPINHMIEIVDGITIIDTITNWIEGVNYRISISSDMSGVNIMVYDASSRVPMNFEAYHFDTIMDTGEKHFEVSPILVAESYTSIIQQFTDSVGTRTGIDPYGYFDLNRGTVRHTSDEIQTIDDKFYLVSPDGDHLRLDDYELSFDYTLTSGILTVSLPGVILDITSSYINATIDDTIHFLNFGGMFDHGRIKVIKYSSTIHIIHDDVSILTARTVSNLRDTVKVSGAAKYTISGIKIIFETGQNINQNQLVMEGTPFSITYHRDLDFYTADAIIVGVKDGDVNLNLDNGYLHRIEGDTIYSINDILTCAPDCSDWMQEITFTNEYGRAIISPVTTLRSVQQYGLLSTIAGDNRITDADATEIRSTSFKAPGEINTKNYMAVSSKSGFYEKSIKIDSLDTYYSGDIILQDDGIVRIILAEDDLGNKEYIEFKYNKYSYGDPALLRVNDSKTIGMKHLITYGNQRTGSYQTLEYRDETTSTLVDECPPGETCIVENEEEGAGGRFIIIEKNDRHDWAGFKEVHPIITNYIPLKVEIYGIGSSYHVFINGELLSSEPYSEPIRPEISFNRDISSSYTDVLGYGVNTGGQISFLEAKPGYSGGVESLQSVNGALIFRVDNTAHILPNGSNESLITTDFELPASDLPSIKIDYETSSQYTSGQIYFEADGEKFGIDHSSWGLYEFDNTNNTEDQLIYDWSNQYNSSRRVQFRVGFNAFNTIQDGGFRHNATMYFGSYVNTVYTIQDMSLKDEVKLTTPYGLNVTNDDLTSEIACIDCRAETIITGEDMIKPYLRFSSDNVIKLHSFDFGHQSLRIITENINDNEVKVLQINGPSPNYILGTGNSYAIRLDPGQSISRNIYLTNANASTFEIASDFYQDSMINQGTKEGYLKFSRSATEYAQIYMMDHNAYLSLPEYNEDLLIGEVYDRIHFTATLTIDLNGTITATINGNGIDASTTANVTILPDFGDLITIEVGHDSSSNTNYIYADNIVFPNYTTEIFSASSVNAQQYNAYVFDRTAVSIDREYDAGARYLSVISKSVFSGGQLKASVNGIDLETRNFGNFLQSSYRASTFYIPTSIDTSQLVNVMIESDNVFNVYQLGFLEYHSPDNVLLAASSNGDDTSIKFSDSVNPFADGSNRYLYRDFTNTQLLYNFDIEDSLRDESGRANHFDPTEESNDNVQFHDDFARFNVGGTSNLSQSKLVTTPINDHIDPTGGLTWGLSFRLNTIDGNLMHVFDDDFGDPLDNSIVSHSPNVLYFDNGYEIGFHSTSPDYDYFDIIWIKFLGFEARWWLHQGMGQGDIVNLKIELLDPNNFGSTQGDEAIIAHVNGHKLQPSYNNYNPVMLYDPNIHFITGNLFIAGDTDDEIDVFQYFLEEGEMTDYEFDTITAKDSYWDAPNPQGSNSEQYIALDRDINQDFSIDLNNDYKITLNPNGQQLITTRSIDNDTRSYRQFNHDAIQFAVTVQDRYSPVQTTMFDPDPHSLRDSSPSTLDAMHDWSLLELDVGDNSDGFILIVNLRVAINELGPMYEDEFQDLYGIIEVGDANLDLSGFETGHTVFATSYEKEDGNFDLEYMDLLIKSISGINNKDHRVKDPIAHENRDQLESESRKEYGWTTLHLPMQDKIHISMLDIVEKFNSNIESYVFGNYSTSVDSAYSTNTFKWFPQTWNYYDSLLCYKNSEDNSVCTDDHTESEILGNASRYHYEMGYYYEAPIDMFSSVGSPSNGYLGAYGYKGEYKGFRGMAIASTTGLVIDDIVFHKDPRMQKDFPSEGQLSSYYETESTSTYSDNQIWQSAPVSADGTIFVHNYIDYTKADYLTTTAYTTLFTEIATVGRLRFSSNHPAMIFVGDQMVASYAGGYAFDDPNIPNMVVDIPLLGGDNDITIIGIHEENPSQSTTMVEPNKDGWMIKFDIMTEAGSSFTEFHQKNPGFEDGMATDLNILPMFLNRDIDSDMYEDDPSLRNYTSDEQRQDLTKFHTTMPIEGDKFVLDSNPYISDYINTESAGYINSTLMVDMSQYLSGYDNGKDLNGFFIGQSVIQTSLDAIGSKTDGDRMAYIDIFAENLDDIEAVYINQYRFLFDDGITSNPEQYDCSTDATDTGPGVYLCSELYTIEQIHTLDDVTHSLQTAAIDIEIHQDPEQIFDFYRIILPLSENFHTVTMKYGFNHASSTANYTSIADSYRAMMGLGFGYGNYINSIFEGDELEFDSTRMVFGPDSYDPNDFRSAQRKSAVAMTESTNSNNPIIKYQPLSRQPQGTAIISASYWTSADGAVHLNREIYLGVKTSRPFCEDLNENTPVELSYAYTMIESDPYTAQYVSNIVENKLLINGDNEYYSAETGNNLDSFVSLTDISSSPLVDHAQKQNQYLSTKMDLEYSNSSSIDLMSFGELSVLSTADGTILQLPVGSEYHIITPEGRSYQPKSLNATGLTTSLSEAEISGYIPTGFASLATQSTSTGITLAASTSPTTTGEVGAISFSTSSLSGTFYPIAGIIQLNTFEGYEISHYLNFDQTYISHKDHYVYQTISQDSSLTWLNEAGARLTQELTADVTLGTDDQVTGDFMGNNIHAMGSNMDQISNDPAGSSQYSENGIPSAEEIEELSLSQAAAQQQAESSIEFLGGSLVFTINSVNLAIHTVKSFASFIGGLFSPITNAVTNALVAFMHSKLGEILCAAIVNLTLNSVQLAMRSLSFLFDIATDILGPLNVITDKVANFFKDAASRALTFMSNAWGNYTEYQVNKFYNDTEGIGIYDVELNGDLPTTLRKENNVNTMTDLAHSLGMNGSILELIRMGDTYKRAWQRLLIVTVQGIVGGSDVGMNYAMTDLFGDENYNDGDQFQIQQDYLDPTPTRLFPSNLLRLDAFFAKHGRSPEERDQRVEKMEWFAKSYGLKLVYDTTELGKAPANRSINFNNYDIIARPEGVKLGGDYQYSGGWAYFFALQEDMMIPLLKGVASYSVQASIELAIKHLGGVMISDYNKAVGQDLVISDNVKSLIASGSRVPSELISHLPVVVQNQIHALSSLINNFEFGLTFSIGPNNAGFVTGETVSQFIEDNVENYKEERELDPEELGVDDNRDANGDEINTDDGGFGITETMWIYGWEILPNLIPGKAVWGLAQDLKSFRYGDLLIDQAIGGLLIPIGIRDLGRGRTFVSPRDAMDDLAKKGLDPALVKKGKADGGLEIFKYDVQLPRGFNWLNSLARKFDTYTGDGFAGAMRAAFLPLALFYDVFKWGIHKFDGYIKRMNPSELKNLADDTSEMIVKKVKTIDISNFSPSDLKKIGLHESNLRSLNVKLSDRVLNDLREDLSKKMTKNLEKAGFDAAQERRYFEFLFDSKFSDIDTSDTKSLMDKIIQKEGLSGAITSMNAILNRAAITSLQELDYSPSLASKIANAIWAIPGTTASAATSTATAVAKGTATSIGIAMFGPGAMIFGSIFNAFRWTISTAEGIFHLIPAYRYAKQQLVQGTTYMADGLQGLIARGYRIIGDWREERSLNEILEDYKKNGNYDSPREALEAALRDGHSRMKILEFKMSEIDNHIDNIVADFDGNGIFDDYEFEDALLCVNPTGSPFLELQSTSHCKNKDSITKFLIKDRVEGYLDDIDTYDDLVNYRNNLAPLSVNDWDRSFANRLINIIDFLDQSSGKSFAQHAIAANSVADNLNPHYNIAMTKFFIDNDIEFTPDEIRKIVLNDKDSWPDSLKDWASIDPNTRNLNHIRAMIFNNNRDLALSEMKPFYDVLKDIKFKSVVKMDGSQDTKKASLVEMYEFVENLDGEDIYLSGKSADFEFLGFTGVKTGLLGDLGEFVAGIRSISIMFEDFAKKTGKKVNDILNDPAFIEIFAKGITISSAKNGIDIVLTIPYKNLDNLLPSNSAYSDHTKFIHSWTEVKMKSSLDITFHSGAAPFMYGSDIMTKMQTMHYRVAELANIGQWDKEILNNYLKELSMIYEANAKIAKFQKTDNVISPFVVKRDTRIATLEWQVFLLDPSKGPTGNQGNYFDLVRLDNGHQSPVPSFRGNQAHYIEDEMVIFPNLLDGKDIWNPNANNGYGGFDFTNLQYSNNQFIDMSNDKHLDYIMDKIYRLYGTDNGNSAQYHDLIGTNYVDRVHDEVIFRYRDSSGSWTTAQNSQQVTKIKSASVLETEVTPSVLSERGMRWENGNPDNGNPVQIQKGYIQINHKIDSSIDSDVTNWANSEAISISTANLRYQLFSSIKTVTGTPNLFKIDLKVIDTLGQSSIKALQIEATSPGIALDKLLILFSDQSIDRAGIDFQLLTDVTYTGSHTSLLNFDRQIFKGSKMVTIVNIESMYLRGMSDTQFNHLDILLAEFKKLSGDIIDDLIDNNLVIVKDNQKRIWFANYDPQNPPTQKEIENRLKQQLKYMVNDVSFATYTSKKESYAMKDIFTSEMDSRIEDLLNAKLYKQGITSITQTKYSYLSGRFGQDIADEIKNAAGKLFEGLLLKDGKTLHGGDKRKIAYFEGVTGKKANINWGSTVRPNSKGEFTFEFPHILISENNEIAIFVYNNGDNTYSIVKHNLVGKGNLINREAFLVGSELTTAMKSKKIINEIATIKPDDIDKKPAYFRFLYHYINHKETSNTKGFVKAMIEAKVIVIRDQPGGNFADTIQKYNDDLIARATEPYLRNYRDQAKGTELETIFGTDRTETRMGYDYRGQYVMALENKLKEMFDQKMAKYLDYNNPEFEIQIKMQNGKTKTITSLKDYYHNMKAEMIKRLTESSSENDKIYGTFLLFREVFDNIMKFGIDRKSVGPNGAEGIFRGIDKRGRSADDLLAATMYENNQMDLNDPSKINSVKDFLHYSVFGQRGLVRIVGSQDLPQNIDKFQLNNLLELVSAVTGKSNIGVNDLFDVLNNYNNAVEKILKSIKNTDNDFLGDFLAGKFFAFEPSLGSASGYIDLGGANSVNEFIEGYIETNRFIIKLLRNPENFNDREKRSILTSYIGWLTNILLNRMFIKNS